MPNDKYLIQSPKGEKIPSALNDKLSSTMQKLGIPSGDGWRYVILPEQNWQDTTQTYGQTMPHHTNTAFSVLPAKVTYLRQKHLDTANQDDFITTLAHEYGHRKLNSTKESDADNYARQSLAEYRKYGQSNDGALASIKENANLKKIQITPAPIPPQALMGLPTPPSNSSFGVLGQGALHGLPKK